MEGVVYNVRPTWIRAWYYQCIKSISDVVITNTINATNYGL